MAQDDFPDEPEPEPSLLDRAWGMLDPEDVDYGLPNAQAAEEVVLLTGKDAERAADMMGCPRIDPEAVLLGSRKAVVGW